MKEETDDRLDVASLCFGCRVFDVEIVLEGQNNFIGQHGIAWEGGGTPRDRRIDERPLTESDIGSKTYETPAKSEPETPFSANPLDTLNRTPGLDP